MQINKSIQWLPVGSSELDLTGDISQTYDALDKAELLWGETKQSGIFRELLETRGLSIYDHSIEDHFTGSSILLNIKTEKILMTFHPWYKLWLQLGGHDDGEHNPIAVAAHEAQEESGITNLYICNHPVMVDPHAAYACKSARGSTNNHHYDICYLAITDENTFAITEESVDMRWFSLDEIKKLAASGEAQQRAVDMTTNALLLYRALKVEKTFPFAEIDK
jgi:8-oxo-dGTP pyrophosphatase MutT (NUDIX family)